ncbi:MAG TPA: hypothetical protein VN616_06065 [Puia sp.]|nr:hypothetical protein [Puia sp.]
MKPGTDTFKEQLILPQGSDSPVRKQYSITLRIPMLRIHTLLIRTLRIPALRMSALFLLLLAVASTRTFAQGNNAPYSQFGLGDLDNGYYNRTTGLANTGIAYRSNRFLINNNPASFTGLSDQYFTMETAIRGQYSSYAGSQVNVASTDAADITFRKLVLGIKLSHHWGSSIGLLPYSTQNYEFQVPYNIAGTTLQIADHYYQGHGSVNRAYWANAFEFFHHLSIGVDASYIFGQLNQNDIIQATSTGATLVSTTNNTSLQNLYVTYGAQLYGRVGRNWNYSIGGTYSGKGSLLAASTKQVLNNDSIMLQNIQNQEGYLDLPEAWGVGIALTNKQKYTFVADYRYQNWNGVASQNAYPGQAYSLASAQRGSIGFEISKKKAFYNTMVELNYLQAGLFYENSYLQINGQQIKDYGVSFGFGANGLKSPLSYSVIFQYGIKGTTKNDLIRQNYADVTFIINFGQIWYTKGKKFD